MRDSDFLTSVLAAAAFAAALLLAPSNARAQSQCSATTVSQLAAGAGNSLRADRCFGLANV